MKFLRSNMITIGSAAAKAGLKYAQDLREYINQYDSDKSKNQNLYKICKQLLSEKGIDINTVISIKAIPPKNNVAKADFILVLTFWDGKIQKIGVSVKKGSVSSISFNNQPLSSFIESKFFSDLPHAYIGMSKWLGLSPYKEQWSVDYNHETRSQGCYLLQELEIQEKKEMITFMTRRDVLLNILTKTFINNCDNDDEKADLLMYPLKENSMSFNSLVICNTAILVNQLMNEYDLDPNVLQNINPNHPPEPGFRKDRKVNQAQNTLSFFNNLFHLQRKSGSGEQKDNLLAQVHLDTLSQKWKQIKKNINQSKAGKRTNANQEVFRKVLKAHFPEINQEEYIIRSSPYGYELFKEDFQSFWNKVVKYFNFTNCDEKTVFMGLSYILGREEYTPTEAFKKNHIEKMDHKKLLEFNGLPYYCLKGSIRQQIHTFFENNIEIFLRLSIFTGKNNNYKGIIFNETPYNETKCFKPILISQNNFIHYLVNMFKETHGFHNENKSLDLGGLYLKRYGGGGSNATEYTRSKFVLQLHKGKLVNLSQLNELPINMV